MKKVIVISTSLRRGSNSDMFADQFAEGAKSAGNEVEKISLVGKNIQFCKGCLGCQKLGRCVINDDGSVTADPAQPYLVGYYSSWAMEGPSNQVMFVGKDGNTTFKPVPDGVI